MRGQYHWKEKEGHSIKILTYHFYWPISYNIIALVPIILYKNFPVINLNVDLFIKDPWNQEIFIPVILKHGCTLISHKKILENTGIQTPSHTKLKQDTWE